MQTIRANDSDRFARFTVHLLAALRLLREVRGKLDDPYRPVIRHKCLIRHSSNVGRGYFIDAVDRAKQFAPVVIACLIQAERERQSLIRSQRPDQIGFGARLDHFQFLIRDVFLLEPFNLRMDRSRDLLRCVPRNRERVKGEQLWILGSRHSGKPRRIGRDLLVADQRAVKA